MQFFYLSKNIPTNYIEFQSLTNFKRVSLYPNFKIEFNWLSLFYRLAAYLYSSFNYNFSKKN